MTRFLSFALMAGILSLPIVGIVGCSDEASSKTTEKVTGPGGTTTTTDKKEIKSSGSNPPTNSEGQRVEPNK